MQIASKIKTLFATLLVGSMTWATQAQFTAVDINAPVGVGSTVTNPGVVGSYTIVGGGTEFWGDTDQGHYAYYNQTGDFDVRVRAISLTPANRWTKAGIRLAESLDPQTEAIFVYTQPADVTTTDGSGNGANFTATGWRTKRDAGNGVQGGNNETGSGFAPNYPNAWIRMQRVANIVNTYRSGDGATWNQIDSHNLDAVAPPNRWFDHPIPSAALVGLAVSGHNENIAFPVTSTAQFRDFGSPSNAVAITSNPTDRTNVVGQTSTFSFGHAGGFDFLSIQWRTNGVDIPGATGATYTTPALTVANSGVTYSVVASNAFDSSTATSAGALLTVVAAPQLIAATTLNNPNGIYLTFDRQMDGTTVLNPANYAVNNGVTVSGVTLWGAGSNGVKLAVSTLAANTTYTVTVSGVQDSVGSVIFPNPATINVAHAVNYGGITLRRYDGSGDFAIVKNKIATCVTPDRFNPNLPTLEYGTNPQINSPDGNTEQYGAIVNGLYVPGETGNHVFGFAADDNAELWLSTDANPANKVLISQQTSWNGARQFISGDNNIVPLTGNIPLVAGQKYYIEALFQEGGGGDHVSVAVKTPSGPAIINGTQNVIASASFAQVYSFGCPATYVNNLGPVALTGPGNQSAVENSTATFTTVLDGSPPFTTQWYSNNVAIAGATSPSYSFTARLPANGAVFKVVVNNLFSSATNSSTLTVIPAPQMLNAGSRVDPSGTSIYVEFSKDMGASALVPGSYTVNNGVTVSAAAFHNGNLRLVRLTVSSLTVGATYNVTGTGITDPDGNLLNPNPTTRTFTHLGGLNGPAGLTVKRFDGSGSIDNLLNKIATCAVPQRFSSNIVNMEYQTSENNVPDNGNTFADPNTDNYGVWIYGSFVPPVTGNYVFGLANDDNARLYLSTDASPANKVLIINKPAWGGFRDFVLPANGNTVAPLTAGIPLVAGRRYYMEALNSEGGGGDTLSVAVQIPGGPAIIDGTQNVIPRSMFATNYSFGCPPTLFFDDFSSLGPVVITTQPASTTVNELFPATFSVLVGGSPNYSYQWYSNNVALPGATSSTFTFNTLRFANGASYVVVVANGFSSVTSAPAVLTVISDVTPPVVTQILGAPSRTSIGILFSDPITALQATNPANYTITNGAGVVLAHSASVLPELAPDGRSVALRTADQVSGGIYVLVLNNITDRAGVPNQIVPNPTVVPFTASDLFYSPGVVLFRAYPTGGGNAIALLTNHPTFLNNTPDYEAVITGMNSRLAPAPYNNNSRDNYGGSISGHFIPPTSGNWIFYISSDDDGLLLMNTNGPNSSGKVPVRFAPGCCRALSGGLDPTPPISLIAGQAYFIEALFKEGGGGDYVEVAARLQGAVTPLTVIGSGNLAFASRLTITQNPTNLTVLEGQNATFSVDVTVAGAGSGSQRYQWQRSEDNTAASFTNIVGATSSSYTFRAFSVDNGIQFRAIVSLPGLQTNTSTAAVLTVQPDLVRPTLLSARVGENRNVLILTYSEPIDPNVATDAGNFYFFESGAPVGLIRAVNGNVITVTYDSAFLPNTPYVLYGDGQQDEFGNPTDPSTTVTPVFLYQPFGLQHRYSFRNASGNAAGATVIDSVGTAHGVVLGSPATFDGDRVFINGGASASAAYVDLPNGLLSANGAANGGIGSGKITLEGWTRVTGNQNWSRILDFGNSSVGENPGPGGGGDGRDYLFLSAQEGGNVGRHVAVVREVDPLPDASTLNVETSVGYNVSNFGTEFHFVITWDEANGQVRVYENGTLAGSFSSVVPFNEIHDVNVWLGRSQWSGDNNMQGDFNEFRIYNRIITPEEIAFNRTIGPNNSFGTPLAVRIVVQTNLMLDGSTQQAQVFADFSSVSNVNITAQRTFTLISDNPSRVSVSPSSLLTAGTGVTGVANLTATFAGLTSPSVAITVVLKKVLSISQNGGVTTLSWVGGGVLQESTNVNGPWTDSATQTNPQTVPTPPDTKIFFRLR